MSLFLVTAFNEASLVAVPPGHTTTTTTMVNGPLYSTPLEVGDHFCRSCSVLFSEVERVEAPLNCNQFWLITYHESPCLPNLQLQLMLCDKSIYFEEYKNSRPRRKEVFSDIRCILVLHPCRKRC